LSADLAAADAADNSTDGTIDLGNVAGIGGSYQFTGDASSDQSGYSVSSAGDVDGDGLDDLIIGALRADGGGSNSGESYLVLSADLAAADAADNSTDGTIDLGNVAGIGGSYQFTGGAASDQAGNSVSSAGDVDGDGRDDLIIGAPFADGGGLDSGESYLVTAADLAAADAADGSTDGTIELSTIAGVDNVGIDVAVSDDTEAVVDKSSGDTDTVRGVENFVATEVAGQTDTITLSDDFPDIPADTTGVLYDPGRVSGLDNNAEGTFTPLNGDPVINFGPSASDNLSDILALDQPGDIQITSGDETGTVGNISFENFEEINFGITCFARGTLIKTMAGEVAIEDLSVGDKVLTMDTGYQPIRWIGGRKLSRADLEANPKLKPIRIRAGALGPDLPEQDLLVSPQHRVLVRNQVAVRMFDSAEVLIPANKLLTLPGIDIEWDADGVEYFHFLFDAHQIVWSNGAQTESLFTGPEALKAVSPEAREEIATLFPEIVAPGFTPQSARPIPEKGKLMKTLVRRVAKNNKDLVGPSASL